MVNRLTKIALILVFIVACGISCQGIPQRTYVYTIKRDCYGKVERVTSKGSKIDIEFDNGSEVKRITTSSHDIQIASTIVSFFSNLISSIVGVFS